MASKIKLVKNEDVEMVRAEAKKAMEVAKAKFAEAEKHVEKEIRANLKRAVLVAAGLGAAVGALTAYLLLRT